MNNIQPRTKDLTYDQILNMIERLDRFPENSIGCTAHVSDGVWFHIEKSTQRVLFDYIYEDVDYCFDMLCDVGQADGIQSMYADFLTKHHIKLLTFDDGNAYYERVDLNDIDFDTLMNWCNH